MLRQLRVALATTLLITAFAAVNPGIATASATGGCVTNSDSPYHTGYMGGNWGVHGVKATIDPAASYFSDCGYFNDGYSFSAAWVGIQPPNGNAIIQLGWLECDQNGGDPSWCNGTNFGHFVIAYRGCTTGETVIDFGDAPNMSPHTFEVYITTTSEAQARIDGTIVWTRSTSDLQLWCWVPAGYTNHNLKPVFFAERGNRGDGLGLLGGPYLKYTGVRYTLTGRAAGDWLGIGNTGCNAAQPSSGVGRSYCVRDGTTGSDYMNIWTVY